MALKHVVQIREKVTREMAATLMRIRAFISYTDGNAEAIELLRNPEIDEKTGLTKPGPLDHLIAQLSDQVLRHCGHEPEGFVRNPRGVATRAAKRAGKLVGA